MIRSVRWSSRVYQVLVQAYPRAFRDDFMDEMIWCFEELCAAKIQQAGLWGLIQLWGRVLPDWGMTVIKERLLAAGHQSANQIETTFDGQFTSTLAVFSRALRDGYNVKQAFEIIAKNAPEPTRTTFLAMLERIQDGQPWWDVFQQTADELQSPYFQQVIVAMQKQRETGGNLADILDDLNREIYQEVGDVQWAKSVDLEDDYDFETHYPLK